MFVFVAGYYITLATARRVMTKLEIEDAPNSHLEYPINDWLAKHLKDELRGANVLAGRIAHPRREQAQEEGILLMTRFIKTLRDEPSIRDVKEDPLKDQPVREWLVGKAGVQDDELEWLGLWDDFGLTDGGVAPTRNRIRGPLKTVFVPQDVVNRWLESKERDGHKMFFLRNQHLLRDSPSPACRPRTSDVAERLEGRDGVIGESRARRADGRREPRPSPRPARGTIAGSTSISKPELAHPPRTAHRRRRTASSRLRMAYSTYRSAMHDPAPAPTDMARTPSRIALDETLSPYFRACCLALQPRIPPVLDDTHRPRRTLSVGRTTTGPAPLLLGLLRASSAVGVVCAMTRPRA
ncbi:hypothetical protein GGX14DRAFT_575116 [Mycena pura]|uniref:Uncharacterized protein n=1 Tax=Mycena pura TaxID=153505 RepID=A0AAD6UWG8_9AGAR|nr:hypothetical protein GGX14DRAFT_575116 [Mycena pura]